MTTFYSLKSFNKNDRFYVAKMFVIYKKEIKEFATVSQNIKEHLEMLDKRNMLNISDCLVDITESHYSTMYNEFAFFGTPKEFIAKLDGIKRSKSRRPDDAMYKIIKEIDKQIYKYNNKKVIDTAAPHMDAIFNSISSEEFNDGLMKIKNITWGFSNILSDFADVSTRANFTDDAVVKAITRIKMEDIVEK